MLLPRQPLQGFEGLIGLSSLPASTGFGRDGADGQEFFPPETVAGGGDGDALDEGVELRLGLELLLECLATRLEQLDVRFAVGLHVAAQMEHDVVAHLLGVPPFELDLFLGGHAVGIVETRIGHGTLVVLVVHHVEEMREESLAQFRQTEGGGEGRERKRQETERVLEGEAIGGEGQDLGAHGDLIRDLSMHAVEMLEEKHAVVAFEVVEEDDDATVVSLAVDGQVVHRLDEPSRAILTVQENGVVGLDRLVANQDGRLHPLGVRDGFVVGKDQQRGFSLYLGVAVVVGFPYHGARARGRGGDSLGLGQVVVGVHGLDVALMLGQIHALVANGARSPPALVSGSGGSSLLVLDLVGFLAVGASLGRLTKGRLASVMMRETRVPEEVAVAQGARPRGTGN